MRIDVLTLFPDMISSYCNASVLGIALEKNLYQLNVHNPRDHTHDKHKRVDDTPYGGGAGMLLSPQPYIDCLDTILKQINNASAEIIITSPAGKQFNQSLAQKLAQKNNLIILCGRYEGFDQRIKNRASLEISVGDYVLTGGELAALTIIDASLRYVPGVLGDASSNEEESFSEINYLAKLEELGTSKKELEQLLENTKLKSKDQLKKLKLLEHPHYTRPADFRGEKIPPVLESGDHKKIFIWRLEQAILATRKHRPDLLPC